MKKFLPAVLVLTTITMVAVVSCKKDSQLLSAGDSTSYPTRSHFSAPKVDDMCAHLDEFRQRMQTRGNEESLGREEAAWYLSSLANYDFANVKVDYNDIRFDTLYVHVNIINGQISLGDLCLCYNNISKSIDSFYHSLELNEKHFRFIGVSISDNGLVTISLTTTFVSQSRFIYDTLWYFPYNSSTWYIDSLCYSYFSDSEYYSANNYAITMLVYYFNLLEGKPTDPNSGRWFYTITRDSLFYFEDHIDPFGSQFYYNSRLYATDLAFSAPISTKNMFYLLDSYLGLAKSAEEIDDWVVVGNIEFVKGANKHQLIGHHKLIVQYGMLTSNNNNPNDY